MFGFLSQKAKNLQTAYDVSVNANIKSIILRTSEYILVYFQMNQGKVFCFPFLLITETAWDGHPADEDICCR